MAMISIHALREEGDASGEAKRAKKSIFLSTPSARRATPPQSSAGGGGPISIHALREEGDRERARPNASENNFYPRPPRGGRLGAQGVVGIGFGISIHALREEGDAGVGVLHRRHIRFLSTPSARRATWLMPFRMWRRWNFYPRPPRGGRQQKRRKTSPLLFHYKTICTDLEELVQKHPKNSCDLHRTA